MVAAAAPRARRGEAHRRATSTRRRPRSTRPPRWRSRCGNDWLLALIEYERALVAHARGEPARAEDLLHSALGRQVRHDLRPGIAATLDALGALAFDAESTDRGGALLRRRRRAASRDRTRDRAPFDETATRAAHRVGARPPRRRDLRTALDRSREPAARRDDRVRLPGTRRTQAPVGRDGRA